MAERLEKRELPEGVAVFDFGSGGLDLAYEVMRGYDALVLVDVSRQGGEPGTLYVMEPDQEDINAGFEDGEMIDPHGMDPQTVLRFVNAVGGWPGKVVVVACEPLVVEEMGMGLSRRGRGRGGPARVERGAEQVEELRMHELSLSSAILDTVLRHAEGRKVNARGAHRRRAAPGGAVVAGVLLGDRHARHGLRGRAARAARVEARVRCNDCDAEPGRWTSPIFRCPACGGADVEVLSGTEFFVDSIDVGGGVSMHRTKVRVAEDALDANTTIAQANRADFDRESACRW